MDVCQGMGREMAGGLARVRAPSWREHWVSLLAMVGGFALMALAVFPLEAVFQFDPEEGLALAQSLLLQRDYGLYARSLADQTPLHAFLLSGWMGMFGRSLPAVRAFSLVFSAVLLWSAYSLARLYYGRTAGLAAALILAFSYNYLRLSASVMVAAPAMALATLGVYLAHLYKATGRLRCVAASGGLLAAASHCEPLLLILVPIIPLDLFLTVDAPLVSGSSRGPIGGAAGNSPLDEESPLPGAGAWLLFFTGGFLGLMVAFLPENLDLIAGYLTPWALELDPSPGIEPEAAATLRRWFRNDYEIFVLAGLGTWLTLARRRAGEWSLIAWLAGAFALIFFIRPLAYYHYALLSAPLAILAAAGLGESPRELRALLGRGSGPGGAASGPVAGWKAMTWGQRGTALAAVWACLFLAGKAPMKALDFYEKCRKASASPAERRVLDTLATLADRRPRPEWLATDRPMLAFAVGLKAPPELLTGVATRPSRDPVEAEDWIMVLKSYRPPLVLLFTPPASQAVAELLAEGYRAYGLESARLYVRADLPPPPGLE